MYRELSCDLTDEEVLARGQTLALLERDLNVLEEQRKAAAKVAREEIKEKRQDINRTAGEIRTKSARRDVECKEEMLLDARIMRIVRLDTGGVVYSRPLTEDELQLDIEDYLARTEISNEDLHDFESKLAEAAQAQRDAGFTSTRVTLNGKDILVIDTPGVAPTAEQPPKKKRGRGKAKKAAAEAEAGE